MTAFMKCANCLAVIRANADECRICGTASPKPLQRKPKAEPLPAPSPDTTFDAPIEQPHTHSEVIAAWMENYCREHPGTNMHQASIAWLETHGLRRIRGAA